MKKNDSPIESELRQATVLFADISGFTAMSEKMHPEEVTAIMNQCFRMMGECIDCNGGRIDKFIGDCVMVVFGVPDTLEKAPQKAINTALEIRNSVYQFNKEKNLAIPLDVHIGINSGVVLSGMVGSEQKQEYTVMGDTVNLASRLEDASDRGQILVGQLTYNATQYDFNYKALPPITLKGKAEPVPVYELVSAREKTGAGVHTGKQNIIPERTISSRLVGRKNEMNRLRLMLHKVINGEGGIVTITAEAGIGKSRLMAELSADPAMKEVRMFEGKASSIGQNLSYHPVIDLLKKWTGIREDDNEKETMSKFEKAVFSLHPEEADEIIPFVGTLMKLKLPDKYLAHLKDVEAGALEKITFKNVRELLSRASVLNPVIIYIEDIHWADASTIELLISLLRLIEQNRILFISVFRPGYEATGERLLRELDQNYNPFHAHIRLEPLNESESTELIDNLLDISGFPHGLKERISGRAGGNPFFIEEVLRSFIDQGAVILKNSRFEITDKINAVEVPLTINEVIMSRIDRLEKETRDLVKTASVIGRNFFHKIIINVANDIPDINKRLGYLENIQFIREHTRMDEIEYIFKHALAQEAAYGSLLIQKRREIHHMVAEVIEAVFNERLNEFYGMLAYHYNMADNFEKTEEYLIRAGEESLKAAASNEAIYYYKQSLDLYQKRFGDKADPEKIAMMEKNIGIALLNKSYYHECLEYIDRTLAFYGVRFPKHLFMILLKTIINFSIFVFSIYFPSFMWKKEPTEVDKEIAKLMSLRSKALLAGEPIKLFIHSMFRGRMITKFNLIKIENEMGTGSMGPYILTFSWSGISFTLSRKIIELIKDRIGFNILNSGLIYKSAILGYNFMSGDGPYEIDYDDDLINRGIKNADFIIVIGYFYYYCGICTIRGDFINARKGEELLSVIYNIYGNNHGNVCIFTCRTYLLMKTRKFREGINFTEEGIKFEIGKKEFLIWLFYIYALKSRMQIFTGDTDGAIDTLDKADYIITVALSAPSILGEFMLAKFHLNLNLLEDALKKTDINNIKKYTSETGPVAKRTLKVSSKCAMIRTEALKFMGVYSWLINKPAASIKWWLKAIEAGEKIHDRLELSRVYFEIGKRLLEKPVTSKYESRVKKAAALLKNKTRLTPEQYLDKAETMFREMDLQWDLEQVEMVRGSQVN